MKQLSLRFAFQFMLFPSPETSLQTLLVAKVFILWPVICDSNNLFRAWSCSSVKSPWLQGHTIQFCILVRGIFLEQVSHLLLCSICSFLSVWMYLLPPDPPLLSQFCLHSTSNFTTGTFLGPTAVHTIVIQYTEEKYQSPHSCPVHVPPFSPLSDDRSKREEPFSKTHHLLSGVVVQLVAWEPGCMAFCLFPVERGAAVKQEALLETVISPHAPANSLRDWLLLAVMVLPRLDQADSSGFRGRAMLRSKWLEDHHPVYGLVCVLSYNTLWRRTRLLSF